MHYIFPIQAILLGVVLYLPTKTYAQAPRDTQTEFPDTNIFGSPQGNYKRQLALGLPPIRIKAPGVHGRSQQVEFPDTNIFGTPQGNYKKYLEQQGMTLRSKVERYSEGASAGATEVPPETTLFEIDLNKYFAGLPAFVEVTSVDTPGRLYMVRYNRTGKFMMTLSVKTEGKAVLSGAALKKDDFVPGAAGGMHGHVVQLVSDDPDGMRWDSFEWNSSFDSFVAAYNEKHRPLRPTIEPRGAGSEISSKSRSLDGFMFAGYTTGSGGLNAEMNRRGRLDSYDGERKHLLESIDSFANKKYCVNPKFEVKGKHEFGSGKYFGDYSHASLKFDVLPRKGYSIKTATGPAFESKASSGSAASLDFLGNCRGIQLHNVIWGNEVGGHDNYIASDCGKIEIKKKVKLLFNGTHEEVNWVFRSTGIRVLYWSED